ncbi:hypothetical protein AEJ54_24530 [Azospirillum sp. Sp 7]|nr:hypothetical protein AMK58_28330 [Azospirillum brasilense]PWC88184.1 hypothetical protein AEJ54_24530 [Azospirillum sp. Sp 7]
MAQQTGLDARRRRLRSSMTWIDAPQRRRRRRGSGSRSWAFAMRRTTVSRSIARPAMRSVMPARSQGSRRLRGQSDGQGGAAAGRLRQISALRSSAPAFPLRPVASSSPFR